MRFPHRLFLTVFGIVAAALIGSFVIRRVNSAALWLPLGLSIASLAVAILSAFKNELFEFAPAVLGSEVIFAQARPIHASLTVVLPLSFINTGYAEGVVEWVAVKLVRTTDSQSAVLHPTLEVDMLKFWQGKHYLHTGNTIGSFTSFPLESKMVVVKAILFAVPAAAEPFALSEGEYRFDIYLKASNAKRAKVMHSLTYTFSEQFLPEYIFGKTMAIGDLGSRP